MDTIELLKRYWVWLVGVAVLILILVAGILFYRSQLNNQQIALSNAYNNILSAQNPVQQTKLINRLVAENGKTYPGFAYIISAQESMKQGNIADAVSSYLLAVKHLSNAPLLQSYAELMAAYINPAHTLAQRIGDLKKFIQPNEPFFNLASFYLADLYLHTNDYTNAKKVLKGITEQSTTDNSVKIIANRMKDSIDLFQQ